MDAIDRVSAGWRAWFVLAVVTLFASAPGVFHLPALDRDESRFAQASKQMLESGDFIQIRYQDEGRNKKPAGIHWLQSGAVAAFSDADANAIWAYRLPSLIGAVLATLATFWCGAALIGRRAAFLGAAMFGSSLLLTSEGHIAKTDAVLAALTIFAMGALARLYVAGDGSRRLALTFWTAMGAAFLIKGPVAPMVAGLALVCLAAWERRVDWMRPLAWPPGPLLFALLVLPWFIWVQIATSGAFLEGAVGKDLADKVTGASEGHGGWPGYHLLHLPTHFFPATLFVVPALVLAWKNLTETPREHPRGLRFLIAWAAPTWLVFELLPTKLSHYILPAYPALALVCGWAIAELATGRRAPFSRLISGAVFLAGALLLALVSSPLGVGLLQAEAAGDFRRAAEPEAVLASWQAGAGWAALAAGLGAALGAVIALGLRRQALASLAAVASALMIGWHIRAVFLPSQTWLQPSVTARLALEHVCAVPGALGACPDRAPDHVRSVGYAEPSLVFALGTRTTIPPQTRVELPDDPEAYPLAYLLNTEDEAGAAALADLEGRARLQSRCVRRSPAKYALNYSNGDPVAFVALRIDAGPCDDGRLAAR